MAYRRHTHSFRWLVIECFVLRSEGMNFQAALFFLPKKSSLKNVRI